MQAAIIQCLYIVSRSLVRVYVVSGECLIIIDTVGRMTKVRYIQTHVDEETPCMKGGQQSICNHMHCFLN